MEAERVQKDRSRILVNDWLLHIHIEIYKFSLVTDERSNKQLCSRCACSFPDKDRLLYCYDLGTKMAPTAPRRSHSGSQNTAKSTVWNATAF